MQQKEQGNLAMGRVMAVVSAALLILGIYLAQNTVSMALYWTRTEAKITEIEYQYAYGDDSKKEGVQRIKLAYEAGGEQREQELQSGSPDWSAGDKIEIWVDGQNPEKISYGPDNSALLLTGIGVVASGAVCAYNLLRAKKQKKTDT